MEERIIDDEEGRKVTLKRTKDGETDAVEEGGDETEEYVFDTPEEEYDESLVGLTPSQLEQVLEERKKAEEEARAEFAALIASGESALQAENYEEAEKCFAQADRYVFEDERVSNGLWIARTRSFTVKEPCYRLQSAESFRKCGEEVKARTREVFGTELFREREEAKAEEAELAPQVEAKRAEREDAFAANRRYYLVRFLAVLAAFAVMAIGAGVSASFLVRTQSIAPIVLTSVFGGIAVVLFVTALVLSRKLYLAQRLCMQNTVEEATADGARLKALRERILSLNFILED